MGITIGTNNVTLDLNGFTASGGITINTSNVIVENGIVSTITNNGSSVRIEKVLATGTPNGFLINGSNISLLDCQAVNNNTTSTYGFNLNCSNVSLIGCQAVNVEYGFYTNTNCNYVSLIGCQTNATTNGFLIYGGNAICLEKCITHDGTVGFLISYQTSNIVFKECGAFNNGSVGFGIEATTNELVIEKCIAVNSSSGFFTNASVSGVIRECTASCNNYGFSEVFATGNSGAQYVANFSNAATPYTPTSGAPFNPVSLSSSSPLYYWNNAKP